MKKIVPDPPHLKLINTPHSTFHLDLIPPDALAAASDLLLDIYEVIDEYCRTNAGLPRLNRLANAGRGAETAHALIAHALARM